MKLILTLMGGILGLIILGYGMWITYGLLYLGHWLWIVSLIGTVAGVHAVVLGILNLNQSL